MLVSNPATVTKKGIMNKWRVKQVKMVESKQDRVIRKAVTAMDAAMKKALDQIWDTFEKTGVFIEPTFHNMGKETTDFYYDVLKEAYQATQDTLKMQKPEMKKMASTPKVQLPKNKSFEQILRDRKYFGKIMKRGQKLTDRLRKTYLKKIKNQFSKVLPFILSGEMAPREAKKQMQEAWKATKPRVETIFRTETTNYFAKAQVQFFKDEPDIIGYLFDSVRDSSRTSVCKSRHGLVYRPNTRELDENTPALHFNCRSHLIPLANIPQNIKLLEDPTRDPAKRQVEPLPPNFKKGKK